ncbi:MAG: YggT family protein [Candidatus Dadabacteria bacterium]|nr:MAG: YggT family protein [Candidatus Dadabacteria bacterium]
MIIIANFLAGIAYILDALLFMMIILIIARAIISWVNPDPYNPIVRFLNSSTDPLLRPLQRYIPPLGAIDVSPIVAILLLGFLRIFLVDTIRYYARALRPLPFQIPGNLTLDTSAMFTWLC